MVQNKETTLKKSHINPNPPEEKSKPKITQNRSNLQLGSNHTIGSARNLNTLNTCMMGLSQLEEQQVILDGDVDFPQKQGM